MSCFTPVAPPPAPAPPPVTVPPPPPPPAPAPPPPGVPPAPAPPPGSAGVLVDLANSGLVPDCITALYPLSGIVASGSFSVLTTFLVELLLTNPGSATATINIGLSADTTNWTVYDAYDGMGTANPATVHSIPVPPGASVYTRWRVTSETAMPTGTGVFTIDTGTSTIKFNVTFTGTTLVFPCQAPSGGE